MTHIARKPTEYLTRKDPNELSLVDVLRLAKEGFALVDVESMLSASKLYQSQEIINRIVGRSAKTIRKQVAMGQALRLSSQQSVLAYQYARGLEAATSVFGCQRLAEDWLGRPCKHLAGMIPLEAIENAIGYRAVEDYLERITRGVYQ